MVTILLSDVQRAKANKGDTFGAAVVSTVIRECDILSILPIETIGTTEVYDRRSNSIATVGFRAGRGQRFGAVSAKSFDEVSDAIFQLGAEIDIDKTDYRDKNAPNLLMERVENAIEGMSWVFNDKFINGDHASSIHEFEGIKVRLATLGSGQIIHGDTSSTTLDVRASASPSESQLYQFLDRIDQAVDTLDGHTGDIALTSSDFIATLRSVLRRLGKYTEYPATDKNTNTAFAGRKTSAVKGAGPQLIYPVDKKLAWYDMGYKADQSTVVIGTETLSYGNACRPVYFMKLGRPYIHGIQQYDIETVGPELLDDMVTYRVTVDWPVGLHHVHPKSISKLGGVRVA